MFTKLYSGDYEFLKNLDADWENTADYETLYQIAHILHEFLFFNSADDVFKFIDNPNRIVARYSGVALTARTEIKEIVDEYEEEVKAVK